MLRIYPDEIDLLPPKFKAYSLMNFFHIHSNLVRYWLDECGLPHVKEETAVVVDREQFRQWCIDTGRMKVPVKPKVVGGRLGRSPRR